MMEPFYKRLWFKIMAVILVFAVIVALVVVLPMTGWLDKDPVAVAEEQFAAGQDAEARLTLEQLIAVEPDNVGAIRLLIESWAEVDSREELRWRSLLADHEPQDTENLREILRLAIPMNRFPLAEVSLRALYDQDPAVADDPEWLLSHALTMASLGQFQQAATSARQAQVFYPENESLDMIVALADVQNEETSDTQRLAAIETLRKTVEHPALGIHSLRGIRHGYRRLGNDAQALQVSEQIVNLPQAELADWLIHADLLLKESPESIDYVWPKLSEYAVSNKTAFSMVLTWMQENDRLDLWEDWLSYLQAQGLPQKRIQAVQLVILGKRKEWDQLLALAEQQDWGEDNYLRELIIARAQRARERSWQMPWRQALEKSREDMVTAQIVVATIADWEEWSDEYLSLLEMINRRHIPLLKWSMRKLYEFHIREKNTLALYRLTQEMARINENDVLVQNNLNYFKLLLGVDRVVSIQKARDLYQAYPDNRSVLATYVLAECLDGKPDSALEALRRLKLSIRESQPLLFYYVLALCQSGQTEELAGFSGQIKKSDLLPEEYALLEQCQNALSY